MPKNSVQFRRGREYYDKKYDLALSLSKEGKSIQEISQQLGISYSAAYHWIRGLRKPELGNVNEFIDHLNKNGPSSALSVLQKFPKHNELFLMASRRGLPAKRVYLGKKYRELATWYYLDGQEPLLKERLEELQKKVDDLKDRLKRMVNK